MNIIEALEDRGIRVKRSWKPGEIWLCCLFCVERGQPRPDYYFRLGVNVQTGDGQCFNCGWKRRGTAVIRLQQVLRLTKYLEAVPVREEIRPRRPRLPEGYEVLYAQDTDYWNRRAYRYLRGRGVTDHQIRKWEIGFTTVGAYAHRLVFPVRYRKRLEGIVTRTLEKKGGYKNSVGDKAIWGIPAGPRARLAVLTEGVLDGLACKRGAGLVDGRRAWDGLAVLGHTLTGRQLDMLRSYREFVLWPDPDRQGLQGFARMRFGLRDELKARVRLVWPQMDDGRDPDELSVRVRRQRIAGAVELTDERAMKLDLWIQENLE